MVRLVYLCRCFIWTLTQCLLTWTVSVEIATLTREDGITKIKVLKQKEVEELIKRHEAEEAKAEKDKKDKEQKEKDKWAEWFFSPPPRHVNKSCVVLSFTLKVWKLIFVDIFSFTQRVTQNITFHALHSWVYSSCTSWWLFDYIPPPLVHMLKCPWIGQLNPGLHPEPLGKPVPMGRVPYRCCTMLWPKEKNK